MTAVFSHGRLRLYLLKLLAEGPKHGYELIRLLEDRFLGMYAPSAGTIYPRLARMEAEGLVEHTAAGGRKVYDITGAGRAELAARADELASLEGDIHASVADLSALASDIEDQVRGSVRDIKRELRDATMYAHRPGRPRSTAGGPAGVAAGGAAASSEEIAGAGRTAGGAAAPDVADLADLQRAVGDLAADVARLARQRGVTDAQVRAATAVVVSALTEIRRLLRAR